MASNSFKVKNSLVLTPKDLSTLTNPEAGDLACDINDNNKIKRYDENAASWVEVGSGGGVGGVDIFFVQDFETASLSSFDSQVGLSLSQTDPLKGRVSALLTHDASVNQLFKQVIPVDAKFRGIPMVLRLDSKSSASNGNLVINIYDETNSQDIIASEQLQLSDEVSGKKTSISFTIPESCESLSYTVTALPESGSPVSRIDDIICEIAASSLLETAVEVPIVTEWQSYTPTFQGFGAPTNIEFHWRQVGEDLEIRGKFTSGTATSDEARVSLPSGSISADTSKIPSIQQVGEAASTAGATGDYTVLIEPSVAYISFGYQSGTASGLEKTVGSNLVVNGQSLSFFASVPCTGLSATTTKTIPLTQSGLIQEADSMIRLDTANGYGSTGTRVRRFLNLRQNLGSDITYLDSVTNGSSFTINVSGVYSISYSFVNDSGLDIGHITRNIPLTDINQGPLTTGTSFVLASDSMDAGVDGGCSWTGYLNAGDIIRPMTNGGRENSARSLREHFSISRQGSLKQVNINPESKITIPTSELRMEGASSRGSTATTIVRFDNIAKIRGDAFEVVSNSVDGTYVRMKKAGILDISASVSLNASSGVLHISQNQLVLTAEPTQNESRATSFTYSANSSTNLKSTFSVAANDLIRVAANTGVIDNGRNKLLLSFQEQDISVSVSNVLPQFSEGDSSVRVDTANGYGSVGTKIRRFSNVRDNLGNDIQYVPSATDGDSFVVQSDGIYNFAYSDNFGAAGWFGLTKNASSLSGAITSLPSDEILSQVAINTVNSNLEVSWSGFLQAGDIVRAHTDGMAQGALTSRVHLTISKVGKPNITSVDVTPFVNVETVETQSSFLDQDATIASGTFITGALTNSNGGGLYKYNSSSGEYTILRDCNINANLSLRNLNNVSNFVLIARNGVAVAIDIINAQAGLWGSCSFSESLKAGDVLTFLCSGGPIDSQKISISAIAQSDQLLTPSDTFSTDTAPLTYAPSSQYTLSTLENAPVGTFITFTSATNSNTKTQTTTAPSQTTSDMNVNGIQLFARSFSVASTASSPSAMAIQIGKGLKGISLQGYQSTGKSGLVSLDYTELGNNKYGFTHKNYNEVTGIFYLDAAYSPNGANNQASFIPEASGTLAISNCYVTINAGKTLPLLAIPTPKVGYLKDVKPSVVNGGSSVAGSFQTRTLNTAEGDFNKFGVLNANQFTLQPGIYDIEASATQYQAFNAYLKIRNITDSTDALYGSAEFSLTTAGTSIRPTVIGRISITSSKTFELQYRVSNSKASDGLGVASSYHDNVYAQVKITKLS